MTLNEMQNLMLEELNKFSPKAANLFEITQVIIKKSNGTTPDGPPFARLLKDKYIYAAGDGIGFFKITRKGKRFIAAGGYTSEASPTHEQKIIPCYNNEDWSEKNDSIYQRIYSTLFKRKCQKTSSLR